MESWVRVLSALTYNDTVGHVHISKEMFSLIYVINNVFYVLKCMDLMEKYGLDCGAFGWTLAVHPGDVDLLFPLQSVCRDLSRIQLFIIL